MIRTTLMGLIAIVPILMLLVPNVYAGQDVYPYCDKLSDELSPRPDCHDRKDYSQTTGLYPCNDGTDKERWQDCPDVSGFDYANNNNTDECANDGFDDGQNNPFNHDRYDECGDDYYEAFIDGCASVEGNTEETCERFTDA
jgi:hypothetical protein